MAAWSEVDKAHDENRHELVLSGESIATRIADSGFDERLFQLTGLNFLEISKCGLQTLSASVGQLVGLTSLMLHGNRLSVLPDSIGLLQKLKFVDLSSNQLSCLPASVGTLKELQTLNVSCNKLISLVDPSAMVQLHVLDASHNLLEELPEGISSPDLCLLATVSFASNQLKSLPDDLHELAALKSLDVSANKLQEIPAALCDCGKLKEFKFGGNPLKDRRLAKMMDQCLTKSVLDYLRTIYVKEQKSGKSAKGGGDKKDKKKRGKGKDEDKEVEDLASNMMKVLHCNPDDGLQVQVTPNVASVRPYIVCCVVRNLNFNKTRNMMKRFIVLQTKLHDGVCAKRTAATIATHDLESIKGPLTYDAQPPAELKIIPLGKRNERSAGALVALLRKEAEELRKEKKRNTISGIHKYLDLLKGKELYPCLIDSSNTVISFPPITNSNVTKVTRSTRHIFVEITSTQSLDVCKKVMEELLQLLLDMGIGQLDEPARVPSAAADQPAAEAEAAQPAEEDGVGGEAEEDDEEEIVEPVLSTGQVLVVQQVKVIDSNGGLRVLYPSRIDLQSQAFRVIRDYE